MRVFFIFFIIIFGSINANAQDMNCLNGLITVYNGQANSDKVEYVSNASISHPLAKDKISDNFGRFELCFPLKFGLSLGPMKIELAGKYKDYAVVNDFDLRNIILGEYTLEILICKKKDLDYKKAELMNMKEFCNIIDDYKRTQENNEILLDTITQLKENSEKMSKVLASLVEKTIHLEIWSNYNMIESDRKKAYNCVLRGELDSIFHYMNFEEKKLQIYHLNKELEDIAKIQDKGKDLVESEKIKESLIRKDREKLIDDLLFMAQASTIKHDYITADSLYKEAIRSSDFNLYSQIEYGDFLFFIGDYKMAIQYYYSAALFIYEYRMAFLEYINDLNEYEDPLWDLVHEVFKKGVNASRLAGIDSLIDEFYDLYDRYVSPSLISLLSPSAQKNKKNETKIDIMIGKFLFYSGYVHFFKEEYNEAKQRMSSSYDFYKKLLNRKQLDPSDIVEITFYLGYVNYLLGDYERTIDLFSELINIFDNGKVCKMELKHIPVVFKILGEIYSIKKDLQKSDLYFIRGLELTEKIEDSKNDLLGLRVDMFFGLANNLYYNKKYEKSVDYIKTAINEMRSFGHKKYHNKCIEAYRMLSLNYLLMKSYSESEMFSNCVLLLGDRKEIDYYYLILSYMYQGKKKEAYLEMKNTFKPTMFNNAFYDDIINEINRVILAIDDHPTCIDQLIKYLSKIKFDNLDKKEHYVPL